MTVRILFTELAPSQVSTLTRHLSKSCGIPTNDVPSNPGYNSIAFYVNEHSSFTEPCRERNGLAWLESSVDGGITVRGWNDAVNIVGKIRTVRA